jgi:hypothetical protein
MRKMQGITAAVLAAMLVFGALAFAEAGPTRAEYKAAVEPICKQDAETGQRILEGALRRVNHDQLGQASGQFFHAATAFGKSIDRLHAVPRPAADEARLLKWFGYLRKVQIYLRKTGKALKEGEKIKARHESIRAESSANAANNVSSVFEFKECRLSRSRFS